MAKRSPRCVITYALKHYLFLKTVLNTKIKRSNGVMQGALKNVNGRWLKPGEVSVEINTVERDETFRKMVHPQAGNLKIVFKH